MDCGAIGDRYLMMCGDAMTVRAEFPILIAVGFLAQLVDGCAVLGYEICSGALLVALGVPLAATRSSVLAAEVVVRGASSASHAWFGNIDRKIFLSLLIPGLIGGLIGAVVCARIPVWAIRPIVWFYLFIVSLVLLFRAILNRTPVTPEIQKPQLGAIAGFLGGIGCVGWSAIFTSNMIARGVSPRYSIGTANLVTLCINAAVCFALWLQLGEMHYDVALAILMGGTLAAPLAAWITRSISPRAAATIVGLLICAVSVAGLYDTLT
jgi:uncharacterized membrane protein YfcA